MGTDTAIWIRDSWQLCDNGSSMIYFIFLTFISSVLFWLSIVLCWCHLQLLVIYIRFRHRYFTHPHTHSVVCKDVENSYSSMEKCHVYTKDVSFHQTCGTQLLYVLAPNIVYSRHIQRPVRFSRVEFCAGFEVMLVTKNNWPGKV